MNFIEGVKDKFKQFKLTSWAVDNRTAVYIIAVLISAYGLTKFNTMPKEQFPDIVIPTIYVQTIYVGNSPKDIENLVTRPIEKQLKANPSGFTLKSKAKLVTCGNLEDNLDLLKDVNWIIEAVLDMAAEAGVDDVERANPDIVPATLVVKRQFGLIRISGPGNDRRIAFEGRDTEGALLWRHELKASDLRFPRNAP